MAKKLDYSGPNRPGRPSGKGSRTFRGHVVPAGDRAAKRSQWKRQIEEEEARKEWFIPLIVLGVCAAVWLVFGAVQGGIAGMAGTGVAFVIVAIFNAIIGVVAAYMTVAIFGASFGNFWPAVLKLAAASTSAGTASMLVPIGCVDLLVYILVLIVAVQILLDLDEGDAKWFTVFFVIVQIAAFVGLVYLLDEYGYAV